MPLIKEKEIFVSFSDNFEFKICGPTKNRQIISNKFDALNAKKISWSGYLIQTGGLLSGFKLAPTFNWFKRNHFILTAAQNIGFKIHYLRTYPDGYPCCQIFYDYDHNYLELLNEIDLLKLFSIGFFAVEIGGDLIDRS